MELKPELVKWVFIVNPAAGGGKAEKLCKDAEKLMQAANIDYERFNTTKAGDAEDITMKMISRGYRFFLVGGGDGSLNEVLQGIMQQNAVPSNSIVFSQLPVGTGNDWRRTHRFPTGIRKSIEMLHCKNVILQDVGKITYPSEPQRTDWFINSAGVGFDAAVAFDANEKKKLGKTGLLVYLAALIRQLFNYKEPLVELEIQGRKESFEGFTVLAGLGKYAGSGMKLIPHAGLNDGFLSVIMVKKISRLKIIFNLVSLFTGGFTRLKEVSVFKCNSINIISSPCQSLQIDGESRGQTPLSIQVIPAAVGVLVC
jgi:YegS/Rv2252/BmrU family lipid kinase